MYIIFLNDTNICKVIAKKYLIRIFQVLKVKKISFIRLLWLYICIAHFVIQIHEGQVQQFINYKSTLSLYSIPHYGNNKTNL